MYRAFGTVAIHKMSNRRTDNERVCVIAVFNLALNKAAWQHGTTFGGVAARAVDGNPNPNFGGGSCSHTTVHTYPTWGVDLQVTAKVGEVEIMRRDLVNHGMCLDKCVYQMISVLWFIHGLADDVYQQRLCVVKKSGVPMMTSSNGNIFRVTGPLWRESTGHRWIPLTLASDEELWCFLWFVSEQAVKQTIETSVI